MQDKRRGPIYAVVLIGVLLAAVGVFLAFQAAPFAMASTSNTVTANVQVPGVCWAMGVNALGGANALSFGSMPPATTYATSVPVTDNNVGGNLASYLWILGANWAGQGAAAGNTILVGNTLYNSVTQGTYIGNALTTTSTNTFIFIPAPTVANPSTGNFIYFGMNVPAGTANGVYTQSITFNNLCTTSPSNTITANVYVPGTCYTSVTPNAITFGTMYPGTTYNTNVLITDNDIGGDVSATMWIGANWISWQSAANTILVAGNVMYSQTSLGSFGGTAMTTNNPTVTSPAIYIPGPTLASPSTGNTIYFGMNVPGGTPAGLYGLTLVIQNSC
jgi:hypothetical protein